MEPDEIHPLLVAFWEARGAARSRLAELGLSNTGAQARDARHMQSPATFVRQMFIDAGLDENDVMVDSVIPGYYRRSKNWDVVAMHRGHLVGVVELKSQELSPGNNANNRIEEAIGSAVDASTVQDLTGAFGGLGMWAAWCMIFNRDCESGAPVRERGARRRAFPIDPVFEPMTYETQYATAIHRFIAQGVYQAGWMLTTWIDEDQVIWYNEPVSTATAETLRMQIDARVRFALRALR